MHVSRDQKPTDWNGAAGESWVAAQDALDEMFRPLEHLLVATAAARPRKRVLDVGCGTGSTTIAIQERLGPDVACVGVDISQSMLEHARRRCGQAPAFLCADAQTHAFEQECFDLLVSRFGVMFFKDAVQALTNLRRAARADAELCFIVWRSPAENPFMTTAERAAANVLPDIPPRVVNAPGQFGFADSNRVRRILEESGWSDAAVTPLDIACSFPEPALARYAARLGPLGSILREVDEPTKARVLAVVLPAFEPYVQGDRVHFTAACWKIVARNTRG